MLERNRQPALGNILTMYSSLSGSARTRRRPPCLSMGLLLVACLWSLGTWAEEAPLKPDVRLVIDISGSMKRNDPQNLRQPAVDLLVRLVPDGAKAGVWTFGRQVNMLVPHQVVTESWRRSASSKAAEINSVGLFTHIGGALEAAAHDLSRGNPGYATSIILLTDGMVDISKDSAENEAEWRRIVDKVLPELKGAGYKVHAVALSNEADKHLMEKLALDTDGAFAVANTAEDLMKIFLQVFDLAAPAQKVPLVNNRFLLDSRVNEFTALIFRRDSAAQTRLIGPDEKVIQAGSTPPDVRWLRTDDYDLITVRKPYEGEWQVEADLEPQSRVTVVSQLSLRVRTLPNNLYRGARQSLTFALQEGGATLAEEAFLSLLDSTLSLTHGADDSHQQPVWSVTMPRTPVPQDGIYTVDLPEFDRLGVYRLNLTVDGGTFQRQFSHMVTVREPFSAELTSAVDEQGVVQTLLTVRAHSDLIVPGQTQIAATIINPARRRLVKPLVLAAQDLWQTPVSMDTSGEYRITVQVTGTNIRNEPFDYLLEPLIHNQQADPVFAEPAPPPPEPEPQVVPPPEPQPEPEETPVVEEPILPAWLLYLLLGLGNLAILGGGYWLFRKLTGEADEGAHEIQEAEVAAAAPKDLPEPEARLMSMGMDGEEEPAMEDLDPDEPSPPIPPDQVQDYMAEIPSIDDLQEELIEQVMGDESEESKEEFAAELRRAQGLDLEEDEMDEAISTLIEELDGNPPPEPPEPDLPDDLDFDEDEK
jgi:uncharacterized protein (TIGR03503 family)